MVVRGPAGRFSANDNNNNNLFAVLADERPDGEVSEGGSGGSSDESYHTAPEFPPRRRSAIAPVAATAAPTAPALAAAAARPRPPRPPRSNRNSTSTSTRLRRGDVAPGRIIHVRNPTGEKSWRGHPGIVLAVDGRKAHVVTLTTWAGKTCEQKWSACTEDPVKYRRWFMLVADGRAPGHDGVPVVELREGKNMPRLCYVACKRTHWLDVSEMEKYMRRGDTDFWVTDESKDDIIKHLKYLDTVETPWIDDAPPKGQPWKPLMAGALRCDGW
ncbi:hypothetical protein UCDDS831_g08181 [Diplodia seriata]|uniref:Uncharacterized protein n=1 Tax=Diplodia seriata TaxID=420778 RepID=A0A0G2DWJ3_9PEZI|nr:hypothetical protein UCDDS831_g08181 [Diplodia seriata]